MGRGIAVAFAYAGHDVALIDLKERDAESFAKLERQALGEIHEGLASLARFGLFDEARIADIERRVSIVAERRMDEAAASADVIFEGVPEIVDLKRDLLARASKAAQPDAIIASTTSTILVDHLSGVIEKPERFLNAHWLNPAYLVPLVEISAGGATDPEITARMKALLESIGKVPVVCAATPGYIVPRIQVLAMNEAARMVDEGVASAADIDKAITYGFGFRYAVLGLLEFIDWGGGDILYYASRYLEGALKNDRYAAPPIISKNMEEGRIGLRTGQGFLDYAGMDVKAYRERRLAAIADLLRHIGLTRPPVLD
ncbi:3-hydroxybutyryl-CoA dehydrogenase [Terrarubrum flagellatum]|uniref:3-hydroxybutyryl-CoA dehydrogenase n=1 Tax=Terrirubrum flagellatum TaxID=2895980 RepID=UPI003145263B